MRRPQDRRKAWYSYPRGEAHGDIAKHVDALRAQQRAYRDTALHHMKLRVGSQDLGGEGMYVNEGSRMRYNLAASTVDTAMSIVASSRPMPQTIVRGGDWKLQRKAKLRNRCLIGQCLDLDLFAKAAMAYDDACTTGLGILHFERDTDSGLPTVSRRLPLSLVWDRVEAVNGMPRQLHMTDLVSRDVLMALYPTKRDKIALAKGPDARDLQDYVIQRDSQADQVIVRWSWRLPPSSQRHEVSERMKEPGRFVMSVDTCTLYDGEWARPRFPFAFFRWAPRQVGFLGRSLIEEIRPAQQRIHKLIQSIEENQDFGSASRVWIEDGSGVDPEQIDNLPMGVRTYRGNPPIFNTFDATPHDLESSIEKIREQAWSQLGLNLSQIQGERNPGITAGVAIIAQEDIGSRRHAMNLRYFEGSMLQCYQALSDINDDVAEEDPSFEVSARARGKFLESTKWKDLKLEEGDVRVSVFPVSSLMTTPQGRQQQLATLVQSGWVPRELAMQLSGLPDLEAYEDLETADLRLVQHQVGKILDGTKDVFPIDEQDRKIAADFARKSLVSATEDGAPADVLLELENFLGRVKALDEASVPPVDLAAMTQAQAPANMPMPVMQ